MCTLRLIISVFFGALMKELDTYESLIKKIREGRAKFLVNSKQKGRCPCECSGMCSAFLLLWCLCRDGHRFTAQLLHFMSWRLCRSLLSCSSVNNFDYLKIQEPKISLFLNLKKKNQDSSELQWHKPSRRLQPIQRWRFQCRKTYTAQVCTQTLGGLIIFVFAKAV